MKKLSNSVSLLTLLIISGYIFSCLFLTGLPIADIFMILAVGLLSYGLISFSLSRYLFFYLFKEYKSIFPYFKEQEFLSHDIKGKIKYLELLYALPRIRACYLFFTNIIKILPTGLTFVYFSAHNFPAERAWLYFLALGIFAISLYSGLIFIELHHVITQHMIDMHRKHDLSAFFVVYSKKRPKRHFIINEHFILIFCLVAFFIQTWLLFIIGRELILERVIWITISGGIVLGRFYFLYRNYFLGGILELERIYYNIGIKENDIISLASSPLLSEFQGIFNNLISKLKKYESEVLCWTIGETEEGRFRSIGEISARVGHNLKGPIHAVYFSLDEIKGELIRNEKVTKHLLHIRKNVKRIEELSSSLNASLRNPEGRKYTHLALAHKEVVNALKHEFTKIEDVQFEFINFDHSNSVKVSHRDLVYVLYNLYKNSLKNFEENCIAFPQIVLKAMGLKGDFAFFLFTDNGTGLSPQDFESFTTLNFDNVSEESFKKGLGLRLTKQIIENNRGVMDCVTEGKGTSFLITLPIS